MNSTQTQTPTRKPVIGEKQRSYNEIVDYLDSHWSVAVDSSLERMRQLDKALGLLSQKINSILIGGTNGKSLTAHFTARLLKEEGLRVGACIRPHVLLYNERFVLNNETVSNKAFTEASNKVIDAAEQLSSKCHTSELLVAIALQLFKDNDIDVAVFEIGSQGASDPAAIVPAKIITITRVTPPNAKCSEAELTERTKKLLSIVRKGSILTSGDQNKTILQLMETLTTQQGGTWAMPIRKLATLTYPFEQLHGRCAALAERGAQLFVENFVYTDPQLATSSLLCRPKGLRGRPTLEAKRLSELNPKKTVEQFWKETVNELPGKFQLLDKEKPSILLDTASNLDAFKNFLLGIRLLHYQRPLKGLTIILGATKDSLHGEEFLKNIRYFFKKTSGQVFICPLEEPLIGTGETTSWDVEQVANDIKSMKVKARACKTFAEALDLAKKSVDERYGLVAIAGSHSVVNAYWKLKGIKRF